MGEKTLEEQTQPIAEISQPRLDVMVREFDLSTWEAEAGRPL